MGARRLELHLGDLIKMGIDRTQLAIGILDLGLEKISGWILLHQGFNNVAKWSLRSYATIQ